MRAEYKRDMSHNYLILHGENPVDTSSYQVRMLTGNAVPSILKCRIQGLDGKFLFYYDITSRQSLASFYEQKKLKASDLKIIFGGFVKIMEEMMEFLLNADQLLLSPEYMYRNTSSASPHPDTYIPAAAFTGIYVSGCGEAEDVFLLSPRRTKGDR